MTDDATEEGTANVAGAGICELDDAGGILRLGAVVPVTEQVSWLPADATGWVPLHCYVVALGAVGDRTHAVMVDTSYPAIEAQVIEQLASTVGDEATLTLVLTRQAEYESIGNAAAVLDRFAVTEAWANSALEESLYFSPRHSPLHQPQRGPWWPHGDRVTTRGFGDADGLDIAGHRFEWISAPLRLLATVWAYHVNTGTLFTSDAFAVGSLDDPGMSPVVDEVVWDDTLLRSALLAKFAWVERADITRIVQQLDGLLDRLDIRCVAPAHGWIVRGPAAARLLADSRDVLDDYCRH